MNQSPSANVVVIGVKMIKHIFFTTISTTFCFKFIFSCNGYSQKYSSEDIMKLSVNNTLCFNLLHDLNDDENKITKTISTDHHFNWLFFQNNFQLKSYRHMELFFLELDLPFYCKNYLIVLLALTTKSWLLSHTSKTIAIDHCFN